MNKKLIGLVVVAAIVIIGFVVLKNNSAGPGAEEKVMPEVPAIDVVLNFMGDWLDARESTETTPVAEGLTQSEALSKAFAEQLQATSFDFEGDSLDPVLCQTVLPNNLRSKTVSETDSNVEILVIANGAQTANQAVVKLIIEDGEWKINSIKCGFGETGPEMGEYSFEQTGQLLKSVPPPLDPNFWYLVYESEGVSGFTAKLMFDASSVCVSNEAVETVCEPDTFQQTARAKVQGDISEAGVMVKRVTFE